MNPTVGRIVHFHPSKNDPLHGRNGADFHAAIVTQVWPNGLVNLCVFPASGQAEQRTSICATPSSDYNYWAWPPREG